MYKFGFNLTMCLIQLCVNSKRTLELSTKKNIKLTEFSTQADFLFKRNQVTHHFEKCYHTLCCLCNSYCATVTDGDLQDCAARAREVRQYFSKLCSLRSQKLKKQKIIKYQLCSRGKSIPNRFSPKYSSQAACHTAFGIEDTLNREITLQGLPLE